MENHYSHNPITTPTQYTSDQHTNNIKKDKSIIKYIQYVHDIISIYPYTNFIFIADCICSHKYTLLAQDIKMSNRFCCIAKRRPNNIFVYFNLIILRNCNFNSFNFDNFCNLSRHKSKTMMSKRVAVHII